MGYTHYWRHRRDLTAAEWAGFTAGLPRLIEAACAMGIAIEGGDGGETAGFRSGPNGDETDIAGRRPNGGQGFHLTRAAKDFDFCKTARKPYDSVVAATLCYIATLHGDAIHVTSDGDVETFAKAGKADAVRLAQVAWPKLAGDLTIPASLHERGRYGARLMTAGRLLLAMGEADAVYIEDRAAMTRVKLPYGSRELDAVWARMGRRYRIEFPILSAEARRIEGMRLERLWRIHGSRAESFEPRQRWEAWMEHD